MNCDKNAKGNLRDGSADNNRVANNENALRQQNGNHNFQKPILKTVQSHNNLNNKFNNNERINNEKNLNINLRNINQSNDKNIINKTKNDKEIIGKEEDISLDQATEVFNSFLQDNMMDNWDISTPVSKADSLTNLSNLNFDQFNTTPSNINLIL